MRGVWVVAAIALTIYLLADLRFVLDAPRGKPCLRDDEGSWAIGLFKGPSPLHLAPIDLDANISRKRQVAGLPAGNPVLTCASVTNVPSNFVADPFLLSSPTFPGNLFLFFETKSNPSMRGEIGAAASADGGATWRHLGIALRERWHVSYPYVFSWRGDTYMLPEAAGSGVLRLYRAVYLPLEWEQVGVVADRPLVDASVVEWEGRWYLFASDPSVPGYRNNAELSIFHAESPLGPWQPHSLNPVMAGDPGAGARMAGRIVQYDGQLYRFGQDCKRTYGHKVVAFRIDALTPTEFTYGRVPFHFNGPREAAAASWNSVRHHHVDALQLPDGSWLAAMDGDSQLSNPITRPLVRKAVAVGTAWMVAAAVLLKRAAQARHGGSSRGRRSPELDEGSIPRPHGLCVLARRGLWAAGLGGGRHTADGVSVA